MAVMFVAPTCSAEGAGARGTSGEPEARGAKIVVGCCRIDTARQTNITPTGDDSGISRRAGRWRR